jgi:hypothetical protein
MADGFTSGRNLGFRPAAAEVLAAPGDYAGMLCDSNPVRKDLVHKEVRRLIGLIIRFCYDYWSKSHEEE